MLRYPGSVRRASGFVQVDKSDTCQAVVDSGGKSVTTRLFVGSSLASRACQQHVEGCPRVHHIREVQHIPEPVRFVNAFFSMKLTLVLSCLNMCNSFYRNSGGANRGRRSEGGCGMNIESVWDYPRPPRLEPFPHRILVKHRGITVADTPASLRILETSHPPVYYIPHSDVTADLLRPSTSRQSFCEFKGLASYWDLVVGGVVVREAGCSYERPVVTYALHHRRCLPQTSVPFCTSF
jgi:uncharacterized protein (DUF427 family)